MSRGRVCRIRGLGLLLSCTLSGGGFVVRRLLPQARQRSVGPFIFFDHFGPAEELPGINHDVRRRP